MTFIQTLGAGPDLVLVPGCPQPPSDLLPLAEGLASSFRVNLVHLPGWGEAQDIGDSTDFSGVARDIAELLGDLSAAHWVGCSFGVYRAVYAFSQGLGPPPLSLIGLGPAVLFDDEQRAAFHGAASVTRAGAAVGPILAGRFLSPAWAASHPSDLDAVSRFVEGVRVERVAADLEAIATCPDVRGSIGAIRVPMYFRVGEADAATPPPYVKELAALAANATVDVVPGAGHLLGREDLPGTIAAIRRFISR